MMEKDFAFFNANRDSIIKDHLNEYVVIKNEQVSGYYTNELEAHKAMASSELGTFMVKKCLPEDGDIIEFFTRRVAFA